MREAAQADAPKAGIYDSGHLGLTGNSGHCREKSPGKIKPDTLGPRLIPRECLGYIVEQFRTQSYGKRDAPCTHRRTASWRLNSSNESVVSGAA